MLVVLLAVLVVIPAVAAPDLGSEYPLATTRGVTVPAPGQQTFVGVAGGRNTAVIAWFDERAGGDARTLNASAIDVDGVRSSAAAGVVIAEHVRTAAVTGTSAGPLAVFGRGKQLELQQLDSSARPAGSAIETAVPAGEIFAIASNGSTIAVAVRGAAGNGTAWILDPQGSVLSSHDMPGSEAAAIVPSAAGYTAVYVKAPCRAPRNCMAKIVEMTLGERPQSTELAIDVPAPVKLAAAASDRTALAIWSGADGVVEYAMLAAGFSTRKQLAELKTREAADVSAAFDGTSFLLSWSGPSVQALRINPNGAPLDESSMTLPVQGAPRIARLARGIAVAWNAASDVYGRVTSDFDALAQLDGLSVANAAPGQRDAAMAPFGAITLAAWTQNHGKRQVYYSVLSNLSEPGEGAVVAGGEEFDNHTPAVAAGSEAALIAWVEETATGFRIMARRVAPSGMLYYEPPITIASEERKGPLRGEEGVSVTSDGGLFLVSWLGADGSIRAARIVENEGKVLGTKPLVVVPAAKGARSKPHAFWSGSEWQFFWAEAAGGKLTIFSCAVSRDWKAAAPRVLHSLQGVPAAFTAASREGGTLLVWSVDGCISAMLLGGQPKSPVVLECAKRNIAALSATPLRSGFMLSWSEGSEAGAATKAMLLDDDGTARESWRVSPEGSASDDAVVTTRGGVPLFGYTRLAPEPQYGGTPRIFVRSMGK